MKRLICTVLVLTVASTAAAQIRRGVGVLESSEVTWSEGDDCARWLGREKVYRVNGVGSYWRCETDTATCSPYSPPCWLKEPAVDAEAAGSDTQVQYNTGDRFDAEEPFSYDPDDNLLKPDRLGTRGVPSYSARAMATSGDGTLGDPWDGWYAAIKTDLGGDLRDFTQITLDDREDGIGYYRISESLYLKGAGKLRGAGSWGSAILVDRDGTFDEGVVYLTDTGEVSFDGRVENVTIYCQEAVDWGIVSDGSINEQGGVRDVRVVGCLEGAIRVGVPGPPHGQMYHLENLLLGYPTGFCLNASGSATSADTDGEVLTDSGGGFTPSALVGDVIMNRSQTMRFCTVTTNTATTITCAAPGLGSDATWEVGDDYIVTDSVSDFCYETADCSGGRSCSLTMDSWIGMDLGGNGANVRIDSPSCFSERGTAVYGSDIAPGSICLRTHGQNGLVANLHAEALEVGVQLGVAGKPADAPVGMHLAGIQCNEVARCVHAINVGLRQEYVVTALRAFNSNVTNLGSIDDDENGVNYTDSMIGIYADGNLMYFRGTPVMDKLTLDNLSGDPRIDFDTTGNDGGIVWDEDDFGGLGRFEFEDQVFSLRGFEALTDFRIDIGSSEYVELDADQATSDPGNHRWNFYPGHLVLSRSLYEGAGGTEDAWIRMDSSSGFDNYLKAESGDTLTWTGRIFRIANDPDTAFPLLQLAGESGNNWNFEAGRSSATSFDFTGPDDSSFVILSDSATDSEDFAQFESRIKIGKEYDSDSALVIDFLGSSNDGYLNYQPCGGGTCGIAGKDRMVMHPGKLVLSASEDDPAQDVAWIRFDAAGTFTDYLRKDEAGKLEWTGNEIAIGDDANETLTLRFDEDTNDGLILWDGSSMTFGTDTDTLFDLNADTNIAFLDMTEFRFTATPTAEHTLSFGARGKIRDNNGGALIVSADGIDATDGIYLRPTGDVDSTPQALFGATDTTLLKLDDSTGATRLEVTSSRQGFQSDAINFYLRDEDNTPNLVGEGTSGALAFHMRGTPGGAVVLGGNATSTGIYLRPLGQGTTTGQLAVTSAAKTSCVTIGVNASDEIVCSGWQGTALVATDCDEAAEVGNTFVVQDTGTASQEWRCLKDSAGAYDWHFRGSSQ